MNMTSFYSADKLRFNSVNKLYLLACEASPVTLSLEQVGAYGLVARLYIYDWDSFYRVVKLIPL